MTIEKTFDPAQIEAHWYPYWESRGLFRPARDDAPPFTIVIPPPNVTGSLHIGHALDNTLQDILVRHARLQGKDALWVVGTDHAGIATQMVVERNLAAEGVRRAELGREAFVERVWKWKEESGGQITRQLRRLGASCDWANERFTMDEGFSKAVTHVFVELHRQGLLYRDKRLVNWDPFFRTAISDLEVEQKEVQGHFWHFRYPLEDGSGFIAIATTRPETILGDGAVAVNPADERYRHLVGKRCLLPIVDRPIPIIADEHVKTDFGSGAVKITAAHDHNDYDVYKRHPEANIPLINLMNADATMNDNCPEAYRGLDRYAARAKVVAAFEALGLLDKVEPHTHMVPHGDRSGVPIEPWLTDQWYVDAATLAGPALEAVRSGAIRVVPETWKKTWYNWLENIQPWCVSRQLWWGHQVPAWYDEDGEVYVAESEEEARAAAGRALTRDSDVLDTWFSSALWPFATLGWPVQVPKQPIFAFAGDKEAFRRLASNYQMSPEVERTAQKVLNPLLNRHYPNDVLVSGFDILFFWDARMAMQGLHFLGEVPWRTLYLHGLVRAPDGSKMSKSKGNTVDPLGLIDRYGADALRFTLAAMESQGRDIKLDEKRVEGYRNFATKLWNAARFAQGHGIGGSDRAEPPAATLAVNRWILAETVKTIQALDLALADFRFDEAANTIYHFVWDRFCDWYLELIKPAFTGDERGTMDDETRAVAGWVLDQILILLHPFMPFITEELWHALSPRTTDLIVARWPRADARAIDRDAVAEVEWLIALVQGVRAARTELNVPPSARVPLGVGMPGEVASHALKGNRAALERMARVELREGVLTTAMNVPVLVEADTLNLSLEGIIDLAAERARLGKAAAAAEKERDALAARLANPAFTAKAKPEAVAKAEEDHGLKRADAERLRAALARLG